MKKLLILTAIIFIVGCSKSDDGIPNEKLGNTWEIVSYKEYDDNGSIITTGWDMDAIVFDDGKKGNAIGYKNKNEYKGRFTMSAHEVSFTFTGHSDLNIKGDIESGGSELGEFLIVQRNGDKKIKEWLIKEV